MRLASTLSDCDVENSSNGDSGILIGKGNVKETCKGAQR